MSTAYFYVHGEVHCYVRVPAVGAGPFLGPATLMKNSTAPSFLGHTEKSPTPQYTPQYKPVFAAASGEMVPADKLYMGQDVRVTLPLQRFSYNVVQAMLATPRHGRVNGPGAETYLDIGTLLQRNGLSFELWLRNAFYGTVNASAYPDLPIGTYFPCCNVAGVFPANLCRDAAKVELLIEANWVQAGGSAGGRVCYSQDPTYFASLPAPTPA